MTYLNLPKRLSYAPALALALILISGCSTAYPSKSFYNFSYKTWDVPGVTVLDFRYSAKGKPIREVSPDFKIQAEETGARQTSITGRLPVGDTLYVKWRTADGLVKEETASLVGRLPPNMDDAIIYFIASNERLSVYVAHETLEKLENNNCKKLHADWRATKTYDPDRLASRFFCQYRLDKVYPEILPLNQ